MLSERRDDLAKLGIAIVAVIHELGDEDGFRQFFNGEVSQCGHDRKRGGDVVTTKVGGGDPCAKWRLGQQLVPSMRFWFHHVQNRRNFCF